MCLADTSDQRFVQALRGKQPLAAGILFTQLHINDRICFFPHKDLWKVKGQSPSGVWNITTTEFSTRRPAAELCS